MQKLETYQREFSDIARQSAQDKGIIGGGFVAWAMMLIGVIVTGTMTYSLTREGMQSNSLWREFVNVAAALPVVLLEGSALALAYGRHHWFRSHDQRRIADVANWCIWLSLASTSVVHFAFGRSGNATVKVVMGVYASYVLPLAIVAVPMLWKKLYDLSPDSAMRAAVLDAEASLRSELVQIQREQNALIVASIRDAMDTKNVQAARASLFEQASIEHSRSIVGFIQAAPDGEAQPVTSHDGDARQAYVNGLAFPDESPAKKAARH